jgi:DNA-binding HxlR family transcriptional regulator
MNCSIARTLDIVGEWWSLLIIRDAFMGASKFDDFHARLGISRNLLTQRLNHLVDNEILQRVPYQGHPPRFGYLLTEKGRDLFHVITALRQWGDRWAAPDGPPLKVRHRSCGHVGKTVSVCSHCGERVDVGEVSLLPGPGSVQGDYDRTSLEGLSTKRRMTTRTPEQ